MRTSMKQSPGRILRVLPAMAAILAAAGTLAACGFFPMVSGSGVMSRSVYPVSACTSIQASHAFQVRVVPDPVFSVIVTCDDNLQPYLVVQREGTGCLRLGLVQGYTYLGVTLTAEVHMPSLRTIDASGASTIRLDPGFSSADPLTVVLSGASVCEAPAIVAGEATFDLSGASIATVSGAASGLSVVVSGASHARLLDCAAPRAQVNLSGASDAAVDVGAGPVRLSASGASTFYFGGSPSFTVCDLSGGSRVVRAR
jgi:hypothetical protein